jgi:hypothetical protein
MDNAVAALPSFEGTYPRELPSGYHLKNLDIHACIIYYIRWVDGTFALMLFTILYSNFE